MSDSNAAVPMHLWIVGVLSLLWNAMGGFDYTMTQTQNAEYMANFTPEQLEFFYGVPTWFVACWAVAVWGGVLGSLLLLMRKKLAVTVFGFSVVSMIATTVYSYGIADGMKVMGEGAALAFSAAIFIIAVFLFIYSRKLSDGGVLR